MKQWQGPLVLDLAGAKGNVAILGAPQSGKTSTLKAFIMATALTHTPAEVNMYIADLGGSALNDFADLPHVGDVATRFDEDKLRRTFAEVAQFLESRERLFGSYRISSAEQLREMHAAGKIPELAAADIFLIIDG